MQERVATPSRCTVHAPQSAIPHPNFVPVRPSSSRSVHKSGVSSGTSTVTGLPLTFRVGMVLKQLLGSGTHVHDGLSVRADDYGLVTPCCACVTNEISLARRRYTADFTGNRCRGCCNDCELERAESGSIRQSGALLMSQ